MSDITPIIAAAFGFLITAIGGYFAIPILHRLKFGQTIREEGPSWHKSKQGTPTMGGIFMMVGVVLSLIICIVVSAIINGDVYKEFTVKNGKLSYFLCGIIMSLGMGLIGFLDDYIKVVKKQNLGLTALQKTIMQSVITASYLVALGLSGMRYVHLPFLGLVDVTSGIGVLFWPIAFFFVYGFTNAVNLTDGVDGLASSVTLVVCCAFMLISGFTAQMGMNAFAAAVAGACGGFLVWNSHPAKVFMGDTGSMFLGGAVVALAFGTGYPAALLLCGIVYLAEALSVVLQVLSFKLTGKRIFKMSPIHHHFEMCGWKEEKIVFVFSLVALIGGAIAALLIIK